MSAQSIFENKLKKYNHLKSIRNRLWTEDGKSRVSVMVGAGFSLNAEKLKESFESMSVWSDLKNKLLEGLGNEEILNFDVLELGQMYADEYGRANLDELLKQAIPDQNYEPSELHSSLLKLPWTDVYTTNYDTLLERTLPNVYERSYQVIYDSSDISSSSSPRIVKLHGSFPSKRPFIFTKKDYETYWKEFAPFVNMVQQSIMETTLVLIGFSGDDPNFEKWTNWVHDNLGDHMPKIYMLAYGEQKREVELSKKGITLIDFKEVYEEIKSSNVYEIMFKDIFDFLSYEDRKDKKEWPFTSYYKHYSSIEEALITLIKNREEYPGWLIMPDIIKKKNVDNIQMCCGSILRMLEKESVLLNKIKLIKELIWLYEKFLIPIDIYFQNVMKEVVNESFKDRKSVDNLYEIGNIVLKLLKEARLDFDESNFNNNIQLLEQLTLKSEQKNQLLSEKIMFKLAKFDFSDVSSMINEWKIPKKELEWCIKKANLLSRIGEINSAIELLEESLDRVRKLLTIKSDDYHLLSVEGIILVRLIQLNHSNNFILKNSRNRLSFLESKLSNPLKELDFMYSRVTPYQRKSGAFIRKGFDPNRIIKTNNFSNLIQTELVDSFCILMISEEFGIQINGGSSIETIKNNAINNIEYLYPFYSWIIYLQIGSFNEIDNFFSRKIIFKAESSKLSVFFNIVMNGIKNKKNTNSHLLLEVISRLYSVLSKEEKNKIDDLALNLFVEKEFYKEYGRIINKIFTPLFERIIFDKNIKEKAEFFSRILKLPVIGDPSGELKDIVLDENEFFEPAFLFYFEINDVGSVSIDSNKNEINRLINILEGEKSNTRDAALARLTRLLETNNLEEEESLRVRDSIINIIKKEKNNFSYYFLESYLVRITKDTTIQEIFAQRRIEQSIPKSYNNSVISIGNGLNNILQDLGNIFPKFIKNDFDNTFVTDDMYKTWLKNFFEWWQSQEKWLLSSNDHVFLGENDNLLIMVIFLKNSFLANIPLSCFSNNDRKKLKEIYDKVLNNNPQIALLLIPVLIRTSVLEDSTIQKLLENILSNEIDISKSAISSIYDLIIFVNKNEITVDLSEIKIELLNLYKYRKETTILQVTKTLKLICHFAPDVFDKNEYQIIIKTLRVMIEDFNVGYYQNSSIFDEEFELLSESTGLAGYIYKKGFATFCIDLEDWKELSGKSQLPEVRKYAPLFD